MATPFATPYMPPAPQVCIDVTKRFDGQCLLGSRFGDWDAYVIVGAQPAQLLTDFTALVGRPRLKPRYALGYHQVGSGALGQTRMRQESALEQWGGR
jgi:alpha-glucosidase (family GH31 glycosyl hydrolase)